MKSLKKWREKIFVLAREIFTSRTKTKIFSRHVLRTDDRTNSRA
ncbi:DUF1661 domain-containing protein [Porphyromonas gulae]|nr:DUF1661 domain-containing protein [Porphyromonas gulae]